jgi:hypothetical protein
MGQKLVLNDTFTDTTLPIIRDDIGLTAGSLALFDMTHSYVTPSSGVPATGSSVYNVAWREAAAVIGSGDASTLAFTLYNTFTSSEGKLERTTKKALHGIVSLTAQGGHKATLEIAQAVSTYLHANPARAYALFLWYQVTRAATNTTNLRDYGIVNLASVASNFLFNGSISNSLGQGRTSVNAASGFTGSANPSNVGLQGKEIFAWGNTAGYNGLNADNGRSAILYRAHIVDVAASGKTFAELDAEDAVNYAAFFASGGRYNGDSYATNPSTIP